MKGFLLSGLFFLLSASGLQAQGKYTVYGDVRGLDNERLMVLSFVGDKLTMDIVPVTNNQFQFSGELEAPRWVQLLLLKDGSDTETTGKLTEFILEASDIYVVGCSKEFKDVKVYGSKMDKVIKAYLREDRELADKSTRLYEQMQQYLSQADSVNAQKLKADILKVIYEERIPLLKSYVRENSNSMIGATLPVFCTLGKKLRKEDYEEMYNSLSEEIRNSKFGENLKSVFTDSTTAKK